jgi:hypothetical protein
MEEGALPLRENRFDPVRDLLSMKEGERRWWQAGGKTRLRWSEWSGPGATEEQKGATGSCNVPLEANIQTLEEG